ncbi:MAG: citrate lyase acyl carrier protein [Candidatus Fimivivens sp.]
MVIKKAAVAGTLESSDARVVVEPLPDGIELEISSSVAQQFLRQIRQTVTEVLACLDVDGIKVKVEDRGALDCTLKARVECAVFRAAEHEGQVNWEALK